MVDKRTAMLCKAFRVPHASNMHPFTIPDTGKGNVSKSRWVIKSNRISACPLGIQQRCWNPDPCLGFTTWGDGVCLGWPLDPSLLPSTCFCWHHGPASPAGSFCSLPMLAAPIFSSKDGPWRKEKPSLQCRRKCSVWKLQTKFMWSMALYRWSARFPFIPQILHCFEDSAGCKPFTQAKW